MQLPPREVINNKAAQQFEVHVDDDVARLKYDLRVGDIELIHTEVPKRLGGQGIANDLAHFALDFAEQQKLRVVPTCPFVRSYLMKHDEYKKLTTRRDD